MRVGALSATGAKGTAPGLAPSCYPGAALPWLRWHYERSSDHSLATCNHWRCLCGLFVLLSGVWRNVAKKPRRKPMNEVIELFRSPLWPRAATLALITIGLAACSSVSSQLDGGRSEATGAPQPGQVAPVNQVDGEPQIASPAVSLAPKPAPVAAMSRAGSPGVHVVAQGETLTKISRLYSKPISGIARANKILATAKLNAGDHLIIPGAHISAGKPKATPAAAQVAPGNQGKPSGVKKAGDRSDLYAGIPTQGCARQGPQQTFR